MTRVDVLTWLGWACYAGGVAAIAVYALHFLQRQGWRRPWNAAGLVFTAIALTQIPMFLQPEATEAFVPKVIAIGCLLTGVGVQAVMALRTRRRSDDRRG